jgi:PKD repeat protein
MKRLLSIIFVGTFFMLNAQHSEVHPCHQAEKTEEMLQNMTAAERHIHESSVEELRLFTEQYLQDHPEAAESNGNRTISYTIPVVFHIIHAGGNENISDEQVLNCLEIMNRDYQKLNVDANNVNSNFLPIVGDVEVAFKLAKRDNNGNCTNGITRTFSTATFGGTEGQRINAVQNAHGNWPGNKYLNVFVAADIVGAAGYTYLPSNWVGTGMNNGIHVLHNYTGAIGTSSTFTSRTMTHEVGHWLNLPHTWGAGNTPGEPGNCNQDDGVNDTPNTIGWTSCNVNGSSCNSLDNVENYMEYSYCSKMFTNGQKARMHAAMNSSTGGRNNVVSANNLIATGVNEPDQLCRADFDASIRQVCVGTEVTFSDYSFHGPTSWTWTFPGTAQGTSTDQNPVVIYTTPGTYNVTLEVSDGTNNVTETKNGFITVLPESSVVPFHEGFEDIASLPSSDWFIENPGNNAAFQITSVGHTGTKSARLGNFGQPAGGLDELLSPPFDLSSITDGMTMTFRYAYRKRSEGNDEWLRVFVSNNCGETWAQRRTIRGSNLSPLIETTSWTPTSQDDWVTVHMTNITSTFWVDNVCFRFQFESDGGNNFYLDDINIYPGDPQDNLSIEQNTVFSDFNVYPNPTEGELNIQFTSENSADYTLELVNMLGQVVESALIKANPGSNLVLMNTEELRSGVYVLRMNTGNSQIIRQVVVK